MEKNNGMAHEIVDNLTDEVIIQRIWEKGLVVEGYDPKLYRKDSAGAWIARESYADRSSVLGWEIDHVYPIERGGDNHFDNLRPMNWNNNVSKGVNYPSYIAAMVSEGNRNVMIEKSRTVNQALQSLLSSIYGI